MDEFSTRLAALTSALSVLTTELADGLGVVDDETLCAVLSEVEIAGRFIDTLRALTAAEVDERSSSELGGSALARRFGQVRGVHVVEQVARCTQTEAARRIKLGRSIAVRRALDGAELAPRHLEVAAGMIHGTVGVEAAICIIRCLDQAEHAASPGDLEAAERALAGSAGEISADLVAVQARVWREALDPDGVADREVELRHRRSFLLGREVAGMTRLHGWADPVDAALLRELLSEGSSPRATPRFLAEGQSREEGMPDPRTREQRQFDVLMGTVRAGIRHGEAPGGNRSLTSITVVVQEEDLETGRGVAWLDGVDEPVSSATARGLLCDAELRRLVLGRDGEVLRLGRRERLFSPAQRRALAVRDGGCVWPGCQAPPGWCEAHHVIEFSMGGCTDIDNGVLLCSAHHHELHASDFAMRMIRGRPHLLAPPWLDPSRRWQRVGHTRALVAPPHGRHAVPRERTA